VVRRVVRFAQTEADQTLLQAVEAALERQFHGNFSALCKQALRQFLLPNQERVVSPMTMQAEIEALQERVARLEREMGERGEPAIERTESAPEVDPLLSRLAPLLEDF
jgi:hypothetical protein